MHFDFSCGPSIPECRFPVINHTPLLSADCLGAGPSIKSTNRFSLNLPNKHSALYHVDLAVACALPVSGCGEGSCVTWKYLRVFSCSLLVTVLRTRWAALADLHTRQQTFLYGCICDVPAVPRTTGCVCHHPFPTHMKISTQACGNMTAHGSSCEHVLHLGLCAVRSFCSAASSRSDSRTSSAAARDASASSSRPRRC